MTAVGLRPAADEALRRLADALEPFGIRNASGNGLAPSAPLLVRGEPETVRAAVARSQHRVVAVVEHLQRRDANLLLSAGASAIVDPAAGTAAVAATLHAVAHGLVVVPGAVRGALERPVFTTREKQILSLVVIGATNREIASRLFVAESTVKMHMTNVLAKLQVRTRKEAVDLVLDPALGLGTGILHITDDDAQDGYGPA